MRTQTNTNTNSNINSGNNFIILPEIKRTRNNQSAPVTKQDINQDNSIPDTEFEEIKEPITHNPFKENEIRNDNPKTPDERARQTYHDMIHTCENAGIKIISDIHACQLLAWVYAYGGANEAVIFNVKLNENILLAQRRLNVYGGEIVNPKLFEMLQGFLKEVEPSMKPEKLRPADYKHPEWAYELCEFYNLSKTSVH